MNVTQDEAYNYFRKKQRHLDRQVPMGGIVPKPAKVQNRATYDLALSGEIPAEVLPLKERDLLFAELHTAGMTDLEISEHTRTTIFVTRYRILDRLGLPPNQPKAETETAA
jgi:hypothetical protein